MKFIRQETDTPWMDGYRDEHGLSYAATDEGKIKFGDIARNILLQQSQYASRYVHGEIPGYPNLAREIEVDGDDDFELALDPEDAPELIMRITAYRGLAANVTMGRGTERGQLVHCTDRQVKAYERFLRGRKLPLPYEEN